jgi:TatD DNase family protein
LPFLCDTHCHLNLDDYAQDLDEVIQRAVDAGIVKILVPGIDFDSSRRAVELSHEHPHLLYPAAGIHPNYAGGIDNSEIGKLKLFIKENPNIRAVGEIGLDYYHEIASKEDQLFVFKAMLNLAEEFNLPVCLHMRESAEDIIAILDEWYENLYIDNHPLSKNPGIFHAFEGSDLILQWGLEHEFMFGIGGKVTFPKSTELRSKLTSIGLEHIVTETDSPYLTPHPNRGKRNEPSHVKYIADEIATTLSVGIDQVLAAIEQNSEQLFHWNGCLK